ncbi:hypothetical protein GUITHDRAFT_118194 [Guillardia theta CCMP2712]|uniref:Major facilitator superfamily (MFS) profile domain-containing protein n=1 Tax=Guillardia theta (strain CCMP2712) TaxID=905079 RepID=L1IIF2_GUITC|nr:hypothetical protein GUITHDRAFT_118194 [Guillardia theta CCMP2712]EKX35595.1 hypothetical protein GUITHDRAFT_118194 [Guillardia theta CCMP2712]|eukprot:XP_005822575.1 hypothetical protein GUITHDRAFT_118194 [Guillardia theta CCMP2712]
MKRTRLDTVVGMSSTVWGLEAGVVTGALLSLQKIFELGERPAVLGMIASSATAGSFFGSSTSGKVADLIGRQKTLSAASLLSFVGCILGATASSLHQVVLGRFVSGVAIGTFGTVIPIYAAECSPSSKRGYIMSLPQMGMSSGISVIEAVLCYDSTESSLQISYIVSAIAFSYGHTYKTLFLFNAIFALYAFALSLSSLDSPRWLLRQNRRNECYDAMHFFASSHENDPSIHSKRPEAGWKKLIVLPGMQSTFEDKIHRDLEALADGLENEKYTKQQASEHHPRDKMTTRRIQKALLICLGLQVIQQFSGINAIISFSPSILKEGNVVARIRDFFMWLGLRSHDATFAMLATAAVYTPKLIANDLPHHALDGSLRKTHHPPHNSSAPVCFSRALVDLHEPKAERLVLVFFALAARSAHAFFSVSLGPIPSILSSELLPTHARATGMSFLMSAQYTANCLVIYSFPFLQLKFGSSAVLAGYSSFILSSWIFIFAFVPETKGVNLEDIVL